jgi:hypothetical protein
MLLYFCVRKYTHIANGEWYDVRTVDSWDSMIPRRGHLDRRGSLRLLPVVRDSAGC